MKRSKSLLIGTAAILSIAVSAPTWAVCNDPPTSRYAIKGAEVYDKKSQLTWQRCTVGQRWREGVGCVGVIKTMTWDEAMQQASDGWRVPTADELKSIVSPTCKNPAVNEAAFPDLELNKPNYWTSSGVGILRAFSVNFGGGDIVPGYGPTETGVVRLVRGGPAPAQTQKRAAAPPARPTAQAAPRTTATRVVCKDPPTSRYVIKGAEVYDTQTQLTWQRCSIGQHWQEGAGCVGVVRTTMTEDSIRAAERGGWRRPTMHELATLISPTCKNPAINEEAFPDMELSKLSYGSVDFSDGSLIKLGPPGAASRPPAVRMVRGGQSAVAPSVPEPAAQEAPRTTISTRVVCKDPATSRYVIKDAEVYDTLTQLTWQRCSVGQRWQEGAGCVGVIRQMKWEEGSRQARGGWVVPTLNELVTLTSPTCRNPAINEEAFPDMEFNKLLYWASPDSVFPGVPSTVNFANSGTLTSDKFGGSSAVRLMRSGQ